MKIYLVFFVALLVLSTSCNSLRIEKRHYTKGWHIDRLERNRAFVVSAEKAKCDLVNTANAEQFSQNQMRPMHAMKEETVLQKQNTSDRMQEILSVKFF
jgi:hypothetical protein